jgi:hypothetical protein
LQLGRPLKLQSYSLRDENEGHRVEACAFGAITYQNPDPVQQARGRELLKQYGARMMIPPIRFVSGIDTRLISISVATPGFQSKREQPCRATARTRPPKTLRQRFLRRTHFYFCDLPLIASFDGPFQIL